MFYIQEHVSIWRFHFLSLTVCTLIGSSVAWLIGWSMILEFTLGGAAVARGISPNVVQCLD